MKELALEKTRLDGRYDVLRLLGRGSYAEIYLAKDNFAAPNSPNHSVVIKALNVFLQEEPDVDLERTLIENFQNEAIALDRVRHPNVISRLGHGTARDLRNTIFHYLVLEYLPGGDLMQMCKRDPLSLEKTLFYLEQVCAGLGHAHSKGVIHRDIKPHNLLLDAERKIVKIADFGVARFDASDSPITRVGTNVYAAPEHSPLNVAAELAHGKQPKLTPAADVYSLAKTVYALLTGESPRKFSNAPITAFPTHFTPNWAKDVLSVLERATQTEAEKRIQTVDDFWSEFLRAAKVFEEATCVLKPGTFATAATAKNFTVEIPARPAFSSMPNVQIPTTTQTALPERPKLVVELGGTNINPKARVTDAAVRPKISESELSGATKNPINPPTPHNVENGKRDEIFSSIVETQKPSRVTQFFKRLALRLAVVLLLLGIFTAILGATYNYLQTSGYLPAGLPSLTTKKGVATTDANLRSSPEMGNNIVGYVTKDSELRISGEEGNWYKVEVIRQGQPDNKNITKETRGYIIKRIVEIQ